MNKAYAFYCRAYQTVFRAALPILPYREPVQLDGLSSIVPLLAEKIGLDPAVMASPFISTIVDATSLLIYFRFASWLLGI